MIEVVGTFIVAGVTTAVYGGYAYLTGKLSKPGEPFETTKLIGTVLVGAGAGVAMQALGMPIDEATAVGVFAVIGAAEVGQKIVKPVWNWLVDKLG